MPTPPRHLTAVHRATLERFRAGDRPLNRAIDAVLCELDSRTTEPEAAALRAENARLKAELAETAGKLRAYREFTAQLADSD